MSVDAVQSNPSPRSLANHFRCAAEQAHSCTSSGNASDLQRAWCVALRHLCVNNSPAERIIVFLPGMLPARPRSPALQHQRQSLRRLLLGLVLPWLYPRPVREVNSQKATNSENMAEFMYLLWYTGSQRKYPLRSSSSWHTCSRRAATTRLESSAIGTDYHLISHKGSN